MFKETVTPFRRRAAPGDFQATGNCVTGDTGGVGAGPAEALLLNRRTFGLFTQVGARPGSVGFSEGVTASDQSYGFFIVHGHSRERLTDILRRRDRIRLPFGALGVHINKAHRGSAEWTREIPLTRIAFVRSHPGRLVPPVDVKVGFPNVGTSAG